VPVVMTSECNFPELGSAGGAWICEPSLESLSEALGLALRASDAERGQRGVTGRALVERGYTWKAITETIVNACEAHCR
jgi:hypothetical protein